MILFVQLMLYLFVFIVGASIGSFLNVVIWRVPRKISFVTGRSKCPSCDKQIHSYDLLPIISFFLLKGKCRTCKTKISVRYPLIECLVGLLFVLNVYHFRFNYQALLICLVCSILICISMVDFDTMEIPNGFVLFLIVPAIFSLFLFPNISFVERGIGFFAVSLPMLCIGTLTNGFGGGDVKLIAVGGVLLGWKLVLVATFIALLLGSIVGVYLKSSKKLKANQPFPFGPYLCIGIYVSLLIGERLIECYLTLFQF